jgi:hypothetical protein
VARPVAPVRVHCWHETDSALLHELLPEARVVALLVDPSNPAVAETTTNKMRVAARTPGLELHVLNASTVLRTRAREWCD